MGWINFFNEEGNAMRNHPDITPAEDRHRDLRFTPTIHRYKNTQLWKSDFHSSSNTERVSLIHPLRYLPKGLDCHM